MHRHYAFFLTALLCVATSTWSAELVAPASNGISLPSDYQDWRIIAVLHQLEDGDTPFNRRI